MDHKLLSLTFHKTTRMKLGKQKRTFVFIYYWENIIKINPAIESRNESKNKSSTHNTGDNKKN